MELLSVYKAGLLYAIHAFIKISEVKLVHQGVEIMRPQCARRSHQ